MQRLKADTYLAYAFSSSALQNSLRSLEWQKISSPLTVGSRSSTTTSIHSPKHQKLKWNIPAYFSGLLGSHSCSLNLGITWSKQKQNRGHWLVFFPSVLGQFDHFFPTQNLGFVNWNANGQKEVCNHKKIKKFKKLFISQERESDFCHIFSLLQTPQSDIWRGQNKPETRWTFLERYRERVLKRLST